MAHERHAAASSSATAAEENSLFLDIQHEAPLSGHRQHASIVGSVFYCFLLAGYAVVAAAAPWIFFLIPTLIPALLCSSSAILLLITDIFQQYWVYQVRKVRLQGYYSFSEKMKHIARLPYASVAYGTALMLLVIVWQPHLHILSISTLLRIVMIVEVICAGCFMSIYIGEQKAWNALRPHFFQHAQSAKAAYCKDRVGSQDNMLCTGCVHRYNSLNGQPDILKSLYSALQPSSSLEGLSYHDGGRLSDQQMALLQYQRENLHYLSEEVLRLQECLSKYERSDDGNTPQVDLAHLLAARDQELRALSAEMNQVVSELRLARSLIAERDSEIQRIRVTNDQYVEENERLRAILGEWSARAAELERALEAERMSNNELQKNITKLRSQPAGRSPKEQ